MLQLLMVKHFETLQRRKICTGVQKSLPKPYCKNVPKESEHPAGILSAWVGICSVKYLDGEKCSKRRIWELTE
jgi:hypothetical protein